jgi:hypothetical protein
MRNDLWLTKETGSGITWIGFFDVDISTSRDFWDFNDSSKVFFTGGFIYKSQSGECIYEPIMEPEKLLIPQEFI